MLASIQRELPKMTETVVHAEIEGSNTYDLATTGAAVPGVARAEGQIKGAVASAGDLEKNHAGVLKAAGRERSTA
jgi:hypothetical protein